MLLLPKKLNLTVLMIPVPLKGALLQVHKIPFLD
jgi:hypothetical protein